MNAQLPARSSLWRRIWFGRDGLRVGWSILLFLLVTLAAIVLFGILSDRLHLPEDGRGSLTPLATIADEAVPLLGILIGTFVMGRVEKRPWLDYGLRAPHCATRFVQGAACGFAVLSALLGALVLTHAVVTRPSGAGVATLLHTGLLWAMAFLVVGAFEELAFRGYLFLRLAQSFNPWVAAIIMSLLFGAAHVSNSGESFSGIAMVIAYGLMACLAVWRTGSLWWVIGLHAAWDWGQSYFYGTADSGLAATGRLLVTHPAGPAWLSGGSTGPEGSVLVFPALLVLALCALRFPPRTRIAAPGLRQSVPDAACDG